MHRERQRLVETLFLEAAEIPEASRAQFLAFRCGDDTGLRREVESLLGAHEGGDGVLDEPQPMTVGLMQQLSGLLKADDAAMPPSGKIGAYRVIRVLGSGGMGVVYLAEQERPKRTVALKVIRRGLATASLLRRFEHEAEILGRLHHPGIAQIYEAGVADDGLGPQPYIAMEYIDGRPLTEHATSNKLGTRERLVLMARVCEAVQHAHQRGVIHRDLKPGNILVQAEEIGGTTTSEPGTGTSGTSLGLSGVRGVGQPKILDFGVARIADARAGAGVTTMGTNVGQLIGTLAYMSPEQLASDGREVDTRSDVYALGVVMFQLLTGKLPYDVSNCALPEAVRKIKDDAPTRLGTMGREYRGDLDTIVSKAIEKEKHRRYQSAAELGADIQRLLVGEPIAAKRDSALYVLRKQMLRYKGVVGAAAISVIALVAFAVYAAVSAERFKALAVAEKAASEDARRQKERADGVAQKLQQELFVSNVERGRLEGVSGKVVVAEELLWSEYFRDRESPHARWALWELYERFPCRRTVQGGDLARCLAANSEGSRFAVGTDRRVLTLYDAETGGVLAEDANLSGVPLAVVFEPGGDRVLAGLHTGEAVVMTVGSDDPPRALGNLQKVHEGPTRAVAWSPDGRLLATGGHDRRIALWDASTLERLGEWEAHTQPVCALAFDPSSSRLASGSFESGPAARIGLWSIPDGAPIGSLDARESIAWGVAFSPDGKLLAVAAYDRFGLLHNLETGEQRVLPGKFSGGGSAVAFTPDGSRLIGAGGGECRVWLTEPVQEILTLGQHRASVVGAAWLGAGRAVSVSRDGAIKSWDAKRTIPMRGSGKFGSWCFGTDYSSDGSLLAIASGDGTVVITDTRTRERRPVPTATNLRTRPVRFLPGDRQLLAGCEDGMVRIIDVETGTETARFGTPRSEIFAIGLHPDGDTIATGHRDLAVRLWSLSRRELIRELRDPLIVDRVEGVDFSPDGTLLACSGLRKGVLLWNTKNWEPLVALEGSAQVWPVKFSRDGKLLATGTWGDVVELWEISTRLRVGELKGHRGLISTIAFSPDGEYIASGGDDATVKLWHVRSQRCVLTIDTHHGEATGLSFHPSGDRITTGCQDHAAPTWDLTALEPHIQGNLEYQRARMKAAGEPAAESAPGAPRQRPH